MYAEPGAKACSLSHESNEPNSFYGSSVVESDWAIVSFALELGTRVSANSSRDVTREIGRSVTGGVWDSTNDNNPSAIIQRICQLS